MDESAEPTVAHATPLHEARDDGAKVVAWRLEQTMRLGFAYKEANAFAESDGDLHELEDLLGKGCPPMTALRVAS